VPNSWARSVSFSNTTGRCVVFVGCEVATGCNIRSRNTQPIGALRVVGDAGEFLIAILERTPAANRPDHRLHRGEPAQRLPLAKRDGRVLAIGAGIVGAVASLKSDATTKYLKRVGADVLEILLKRAADAVHRGSHGHHHEHTDGDTGNREKRTHFVRAQ